MTGMKTVQPFDEFYALVVRIQFVAQHGNVSSNGYCAHILGSKVELTFHGLC